MSLIQLNQSLRLVGSNFLNISGAEQTVVGKTVLQYGLQSYESLTLATCITLLKQSPKKVFFDVGANIGIYSLICSKAVPDIVIHAFEPVPDLAKIFKNLIHINNFDNVFLHEIALSDKCGVAPIYISERSDASNSLRKGFRPSKQIVEVKLDTLDKICKTHSLPTLIKIDTESTEPDVIAGGINFIKSNHPFIICEVLPGRTENALMEVLRPLNYTFYHIAQPEFGIAQNTINGDVSYQNRDWLFCPQEMDASFWKSVSKFHELAFE
ncbi:FkbM family methyltransferase [Phormidium yuhuli AB48]|uniref:FkbM family methyltransferase n=1 Tax=Phormidium yuhuli AB48 TaxID=2940671 RepID=A0ABY5AS85_9CYAN|nr:FkbM family methyltransferase [Phormidium yuhuli]USR91771.1 FkbM family methyltransferase [Phormidium yuhuli AB48]